MLLRRNLSSEYFQPYFLRTQIKAAAFRWLIYLKIRFLSWKYLHHKKLPLHTPAKNIQSDVCEKIHLRRPPGMFRRKWTMEGKVPIFHIFRYSHFGSFVGISPTTTANNNNSFSCTFSQIFFGSYFEVLFHKFGIGKSVFMLKCELSMRSFFLRLFECWYLGASHNGLFCSFFFALMMLQKSENHGVKWAAGIILISWVIYKF